MEKDFTYEEMQTVISNFEKDCEKIRADRQKEYGFHFMDNYNKYGLKGYLINDGEITARIEQIEKNIEKGTTCFINKEKALRNALYDKINYAKLLLFWLEKEKWRNPNCVRVNISGVKIIGEDSDILSERIKSIILDGE